MEAWADLAAQLGRFVSALHAFRVERAVEYGVPFHAPQVWRRAHESLWSQIRAGVYPLLSRLEQRIVSHFFERFLELLANAHFTPILTHGDLNEGHVLLDDSEKRVVGVIDFGDMRVTDPALDFGQFPFPFAEVMARGYGPRNASAFLERARCYGRLEPFRAVLLGQDTGDAALVEGGLAAARRDLRDL